MPSNTSLMSISSQGPTNSALITRPTPMPFYLPVSSPYYDRFPQNHQQIHSGFGHEENLPRVAKLRILGETELNRSVSGGCCYPEVKHYESDENSSSDIEVDDEFENDVYLRKRENRFTPSSSLSPDLQTTIEAPRFNTPKPKLSFSIEALIGVQ